jgi:uncharacterized protein YdhG (YjbR/CyaY superfamily)
MDANRKVYNSIDEYIAGFPADIQIKLKELQATIHTAAPEAVEKISYQMPTFFLKGNLVHFAAFKNHIGFYPAPTGIEAFREDLATYKGSKGAIQFPLDQPLPLELVGRITKYRVVENLRKAEEKKRKK